jgi:signal transduction histidine kinase
VSDRPPPLTSLPAPAIDPAEITLTVLDDPEAHAAFVEAFEWKAISAQGVLSLVLSALAFGAHRMLNGQWSKLGASGAAASLGIVVAALLSSVAARRALLRNDRARFWFLLAAQGALHLTWLLAVCLLVRDFFSIIGVAILLAWIFNDTRFLFDSPLLRRQYLAPVVLVDLGLGLLWCLDPAAARAVLPAGGPLVLAAAQLGLVVVTQGAILTVGQQLRDQAHRARELRELQRQVAVYQKEREVLARAARLMEAGIASSKFAHDVATPLAALAAALDEAREITAQAAAALGAAAPGGEALREAGSVLAMAGEAYERVRAMADAHASALRRREPLTPRAAAEVFDRAWGEARTTLVSHKVNRAPEPRVDLEASDLWVTEGHLSTLANLLTNGALQSPDAPLEVRGGVCDPYFYRLVIRDRGVAPEARDEALARIERSLALAPRDGDEAPRRYRGYGIALGIARMLIIRHNGWLSVRSPAEGPGVEMCLVLPRVDPESIPPTDNHPENRG